MGPLAWFWLALTGLSWSVFTGIVMSTRPLSPNTALFLRAVATLALIAGVIFFTLAAQA